MSKQCEDCGKKISSSSYRDNRFCFSCYHRNGHSLKHSELTKETLERMYVDEKMSTIKIGLKFGIAPRTVYKRLCKFGIPTRNRKQASFLKGKLGELSPSWRGGKYILQGYGMVYVGSQNGNSRYKAEHTLKAEGALGRELRKGECVHHINCDRSDNRNENLLVCTSKYHLWLHRRMGDLYAKEHFV